MSGFWTTVDVDLGEPLQNFDPGAGRFCLVNLRFQGAVLGQFAVTPADLPLSRAEFGEMASRAAGPVAAWLAELGREDLTIPELAARTGRSPRWWSERELFARLGEALTSRRARPVSISASIVIIASGRTSSALPEVLAAIGPDLRAGHEAVVIHDGRDAAIEAALTGGGGIRAMIERDLSPEAARHAALQGARRDVVVFLDEGVVPEPGWLQPLLQGFDAPDIGAVFGMVLPARNERPEVIHAHFDRYHSYTRSLPMRFGPEFLRDWRWGIPVWETGGRKVMAIRRSAASSCRPAPGSRSGRSEVWKDLLGSGWLLRYEPLSLSRRADATSELPDGTALSRGAGSMFRHVLAYRRRGTRYELPHVDLLPPWRPVRLGVENLLRRAS